MKLHGNSFILATAAFVFVAAQPVSAQTTEITDVQLNPVDGGINLVLKTSSGSRPQVFTTKRGKSLVADIINTQLRLPQGNSFRQDNPAPGITSVAINQLDANSIRVTVIGEKGVPNTQPVKRGGSGITLSYSPGTEVAAGASIPTAPAASTPSQPAPVVPNPQVTVDGTPAQAAGPGQPGTAAPPFLPRAVAPPVGDIAISNTDASPSVVDLGTQERVPRLVLRDAPVREVLSLLARAANLNLAYAAGGQGADGKPAAAAGGDGPTISLDIENEPVQDVFNYVLRLSGLEANRSGRTIFVGSNLPSATRDTVMRNLRLNQVTVGVALNFLVGLGAESAVSRERQVTSVSAVPVGTGVAPITQSQTTTESRVDTQRVDFQDSKPLLRGLQALGDERTNSLTLIGSPKLVEMAMAQLGQLDIRRRQVAINVKIVDVNLNNTQDFNTSFSFGVGKNFFVNDGGAAALNFGGINPPSRTDVTGSRLTPPITSAPYPNGTTASQFFDYQPNAPFGSDSSVPSGSQPGSVPSGYTRPSFGTDSNPFRSGVSEVDIDPTTGIRTLTYSPPSLFQYPKRFLATLQAQVVSGNAKILTDPTLIVQEGQQAQVNLTQEVVGNVKREITDTAGSSRETITVEKANVGLTLGVKIERIDDNGFVSLSVAPTVRAPQDSAIIENAGRVILVSERSLQSGLVRLRDGQTLILSGIIQDQDRTSVSKIPILGDIPLLGSLFRKTNRENRRQEVIVLLTPQVMDDSERSSYGYNYTPSPEVRRTLERSGLKVPGR
ncbi:AMIN domain-containing protein [Tolypothrix sp. VBCCA 56010]|uniref:AMIN domain-containing protein n=1 Tax=Tolypothrix sp. VBCCA 56010 TaxID=3137731 RepID=UPI003D7D4B8C